MGLDVGISLISCLEAEIHAFEVWRPPSGIIHFRFGCTVFDIVPLECWTQKHRYSRRNFVDISSGSEDTCIWSLQAAILDYPLPVWLHRFWSSPVEMLDPKNVGLAVGISLTSCLEAEIHAFEVWRPPSWIFPLPVWSHSILSGGAPRILKVSK